MKIPLSLCATCSSAAPLSVVGSILSLCPTSFLHCNLSSFTVFWEGYASSLHLLVQWKKTQLDPLSSSLPFPGWTNPVPSHFPWTPRTPSLLTVLVALCWPSSTSPISPHYWGTKLDTIFQPLPPKCHIVGNNPFLWPASYAPANTTQHAVSPHHTRVHCWFMVLINTATILQGTTYNYTTRDWSFWVLSLHWQSPTLSLLWCRNWYQSPGHHQNQY